MIALVRSAACAALKLASASETESGSTERAFSVGRGWCAMKSASPQPGLGSFSSTFSDTIRIPPAAAAATLS